MRLMEMFMALSAPDERLPSSATLDLFDTIYTKVYLPWQFKKLFLLSKMFFVKYFHEKKMRPLLRWSLRIV